MAIYKLSNGMTMTTEDIDAVLDRCGSYMHRAVLAVVHYGKYYVDVDDTKLFVFGDNERQYVLDSNGKLFISTDNLTSLNIAKISKNNMKYEVRALKLLGGYVDIVDGSIVDELDGKKKNNNKGHITMHQLMIAAFKLKELMHCINTTDGQVDINHLNGCHWCNIITNLEPCTRSQNLLHGTILGLLVKYKLFNIDYDSIGFSVNDCYEALNFLSPYNKPTSNWVRRNVLCGANVRMLAHKLI